MWHDGFVCPPVSFHYGMLGDNLCLPFFPIPRFLSIFALENPIMISI